MFIQKKIKELEKLKLEVPKQAEKIIFKFKEQILDLIREEQLFDKGIDGEGNKLQAYTSFTVGLKKLNQQPSNRTTLNDSGDFYKAFDLLFTDQHSIGVFSRDSKTPELIEKYGRNIFTFTVDNNKIINEEIVLKNLIEWLLNTQTFTQI